MKGNMLIVHGGAPTAVINASLYGAVKAAKDSGCGLLPGSPWHSERAACWKY